MSKDVYDYLAKESVSELTITNLDASASSTAVDRTNVAFWGGPITLARVMEATRTYPQGLPIPESGGVSVAFVPAGDSTTIQPPGSEIWRLTGVSLAGEGGTSTITISYYDGTTEQPIKTGISAVVGGVIIGAYGAVSDVEVLSLPILLTNAVYWKFTETGAANPCALTFSYQKVGL